MSNKSQLASRAAIEFSQLQSLFCAIDALENDVGFDGDVRNLIDLGYAYAGQLSQKYSDLSETKEGQQ